MELKISSIGTGISKRLLHEAMCVVINNGWMDWNNGTSREPIIVNKIMTAMVVTIGPMEFSEKTEKQIDMQAMEKSDRKAKQKPYAYRHEISSSGIITNPSELSTIKSPVPKIHCPIISAKKASQMVRKKV